MAAYASNKVKYLLALKNIDFANDTFIIILMNTGFVFNQDTHTSYASLSASELATGYGYTQKTKTLANVVITENTTLDKCVITWDNVSWTAAGGDIGPSPGAIIIDDTSTSPTADPVIGYISFGEDKTQYDGGMVTLSSIGLTIA